MEKVCVRYPNQLSQDMLYSLEYVLLCNRSHFLNMQIFSFSLMLINNVLFIYVPALYSLEYALLCELSSWGMACCAVSLQRLYADTAVQFNTVKKPGKQFPVANLMMNLTVYSILISWPDALTFVTCRLSSTDAHMNYYAGPWDYVENLQPP